MRTKFFLIVLVAVLVAGGVLWFGKEEVKAPVTEEQASSTVVFSNVEAGESVTISFSQTDETATMSGLGYEDVLLVQAISASGARYVNQELSLELWNKGDEITVSVGEEAVFTGSAVETEEDVAESEPTETVPPAATMSLTEEELVAHTWVWKETRMNNDEIITPTKPDAFSITFSLDGNIRGTTDCNGFGGSYSLEEDGTLSYGPFMSTLMFCEGSQEAEFTRMVSDAQRGFVTATGELVLELPYDSGSVIFIPE